MDLSSSPKIRLPHASAGPFWTPLPARPEPDWREIEALLQTPAGHEGPTLSGRRGISSFALVAAALVLGAGVLANTLRTSRDCGSACNVVAATPGPAGKPAPIVATAAPTPDVHIAEGRSVAEPAPEPAAPLAPRRHHHHHRHQFVEPY